MNSNGYYRFPTVRGSVVVFVCEDDLWQVPLDGGRAHRLTSSLSNVSSPRLSPDGNWLAFTSREEGETEVYIMPADGGIPQRLTYLGAASVVAGWTPRGEIVFASNAEQPFAKILNLHTVSPDGEVLRHLPYGPASAISYGPDGRKVIGRNTSDPARWKRYRGGTAGVLWIDNKGNDAFERFLPELNTNFASPMWVDDRIYFISDHDGIGNLYSADLDGDDLVQHSFNTEYYARNASTDGTTIVWHAGGRLWRFDIHTGTVNEIAVEFRSPRVQLQRKFVPAAQYLEHFSPAPDGLAIAVTARGKAFAMSNAEGPVTQLGQPHGTRYRLATWMPDGKGIIAISDEGGEEALELFHPSRGPKTQRLETLPIGRVHSLKVSPDGAFAAMANHRNELLVADLRKQTLKVVHKGQHSGVRGFSWSPDSRWLAFSRDASNHTSVIALYSLAADNCRDITPAMFNDVSPEFDVEGKYLFFLSYREFNPVYDVMHFDLNFPRGVRPYAIALRKDVPFPFAALPQAAAKPAAAEAEPAAPAAASPRRTPKTPARTVASAAPKKAAARKPAETPLVDFDGIADRVTRFPVPEGRYGEIISLKGKVIFTSSPIVGTLDADIDKSDRKPGTTLQVFDFGKQELLTVMRDVRSAKVSHNRQVLYIQGEQGIRAVDVAKLSYEMLLKTDKRESVDLARVTVEIDPAAEWRQMFHEIWRLQRDNFWVENMSGIDWSAVRNRYLPVLARVGTRSEFSDLAWEVQGELGTSHAYELGGDYRRSPVYKQGMLGATFEWDKQRKGWAVRSIVKGDPWDPTATSPLNRIGVDIQAGDIITAIDGSELTPRRSPRMALVGKANCDVRLTVRRKNRKDDVEYTVRTIASETKARYRDWVENNRRTVHQATHGRCGYVHVPNMGPEGYAEFHRSYLAELDKEALIVDVRFNGGGHVSQLLLEKLARKRVGYNVSRWGSPEPYPRDSVAGPVLALTNEYAGSDGDIFSHSFKLMNIGTLVGKRTWGGVIGIWPRHNLADGSRTTQPEFSFWFQDVGWAVENYGTDPDVEVDISPGEWIKGADPQLAASIRIILDRIKKPFALPVFSPYPNLAPPTRTAPPAAPRKRTTGRPAKKIPTETAASPKKQKVVPAPKKAKKKK